MKHLFAFGTMCLTSAVVIAAQPPAAKPNTALQLAPIVTPVAAQPTPVATPPPQQGSPAFYASKIWELTGGTRTLSQIKAGLSGNESQYSLSIDKNMAEKINGVLTQAFDPVPALFQDYIAKTGRPDQLAAIVKWLESPFGKKVQDAEGKAPPLQYNELERTIPLKEPKFSKEREQLYQRYDKVVYATTNKMISETVEFYLLVNNGIKPPTERMPPKEIEQAAKLKRTQMSTLTQQLLPHLFASTYRDMIVDELRIYINFLETDNGRAYLQLTSDAYVYALQKVRPDVLLKLASIFEDELAILSPYSKEPLSEQKQKQLLNTMIKRFGKPPLIGAILEIRGGQITIVRHGAEQEAFGRPNHEFVTTDTIMKDLRKAHMDMRRYYQVVQKRVRMGQ